MTDWKFWPAAFLQGGALGIYGDFMYGASNTRYGSGPVEVLAGPTIGPLLEMARCSHCRPSRRRWKAGKPILPRRPCRM